MEQMVRPRVISSGVNQFNLLREMSQGWWHDPFSGRGARLFYENAGLGSAESTHDSAAVDLTGV